MEKQLPCRPTWRQYSLFILMLLVLIVVHRKEVYAQPGSLIFKDEFTGNALSADWTSENYWSAAGGFAYSVYDWGALTTSKKYSSESYVIETAAKGFTASYWREFRITFGQAAPGDQKTYVLTYGPDSGGQLTLGMSTDNIYYPQILDGVSIYPKLEKDILYKFKIARYRSGLIQIYLDRGAGYGQTPLLEAIDTTYPKLGHFSWQVSTQTAPEVFYVDRVEARVPEVEKPAVREKPEADNLITQVGATSGRSYKVAKLSEGSQIYTDRLFKATSLPSYLKGASFIQTAMDDKRRGEQFEVATFLKKSAVVYVGYDPRGSVLPDWLKSWHKTGDVIGTDDPKMKHLHLYSKLADYWQLYPRPFILGGNLASPAFGAQANYIVIAVESPASEKLEAENALLSGAKVAKDHEGYSGTGFADFVNDSRDYIEWTTQTKIPGTYTIGFQFSNGSKADRKVALSVDNNSAGIATFIPLTSWENWATYSGPRVFLKAGTHKIRLTATGQNGPNVDFLSLSYFGAAPEVVGGGGLARVGHQEPSLFMDVPGSRPVAYPNPFEHSTVISYELHKKEKVNLTVFSALGMAHAVLVDKVLEAGKYQTTFSSHDLPSGIYIYKLELGGVVSVGKVLKK